MSFNTPFNWVIIEHSRASKELIALSKKTLKLKTYSFNVVYKTYKGHFNKEVFEEKKGFVIRDGINYRSEIMGKIIVQNKTMRVIIDSAQRVVKVNNPSSELEFNITPEEHLKALEICKQVKNCEINGLKAYRLEMYAKRGIVAQEYFFDEIFLKQFVIYYANVHTTRSNNETKDEIVYPRMTIDFEKFKQLNNVDKSFFDTSPYVILKKNKLYPSGQFASYKLIDGRYNK